MILPSSLKKISSNSIFLFEYTYKVYLPKQLEIIEDNAFIAGDVEQYKISPKASNFIQEKVWENGFARKTALFFMQLIT